MDDELRYVTRVVWQDPGERVVEIELFACDGDAVGAAMRIAA